MHATGAVAPTGTLTLRVDRLADRVRADRRKVLGWKIRNGLRMLKRAEFLVPLWARLATLLPGVTAMYGRLSIKVTKADGRILNYGLAGYHLVVTAGKNYIAADFAGGASDVNLFKYHALGTGTTAAAAGDTALQTELTTAYNPDNTRATGSQSSSTNTYTTAGTNTVDATAAVTEWGLLTQSATGGGTLLDRQVFTALNLVSGDSVTTTYTFTIS